MMMAMRGGDDEALEVQTAKVDRQKIVQMKRGIRSPALDNAQEQWFARRVAWTEALFSD